MKKGTEKLEKPYAEIVLDRAKKAIKLLHMLGDDSSRSYKDEKDGDFSVRTEGKGIGISYEGLINFVIGDGSLLNVKNPEEPGYITDIRSINNSCGPLHYQISMLAHYAQFAPSVKIGKTDLNAMEIFELLNRCLDIVIKDLLPRGNGVIDASKLFGNKLKSSSGTEE